VDVARGEGKRTTRVFPFFSHAHNADQDSDFYLWPIYTCKTIHSPPLYRRRTRSFYFLYSDKLQKNTETGAYQRRTDLWPFFTRQRDYDGSTRLQILALLEPYLPTSKSIERDYSHLWSLWRSEKNQKNGATSQSLLWNLYRRDTTSSSTNCSAFFGLYQRHRDTKDSKTRLFFLPL
jgi:hypothetical protein